MSDSSFEMSDIHTANVVLLVPMSGPAGGTTFQDHSPVGRVITRYGETKTVTDQYRHYGASGYFDGSGDYLQVADSPDFFFGAGDFTIEAWIRPQVGSGVIQGIVCQRASSGSNHAFSFWVHATDTNLAFECLNNNYLFYNGGKLTYNVWQHVAVCRAGSTIRMFLDGVLIGEQAIVVTLPDFAQVVQIGRASAGLSNGYFKGHMNDVRVTKGVARYTRNFIPPRPLTGDLPPAVLKAHTGAAWRACPLKRWNGAAWVAQLPRWFDGSQWQA